MIAAYLFEHVTDRPALPSGWRWEGSRRPAVGMLAYYGLDARDHCPRQIDQAICGWADAIWVMPAPGGFNGLPVRPCQGTEGPGRGLGRKPWVGRHRRDETPAER